MYCWVVRRPVWLRALIAVWGLWFTAAVSEAPGLHVCAVHAGHAASGALGAHAGHSGHDAHASHRPGASAPDESSRHQSADCTCLGLCCCAASAAPPVGPIELPSDFVVAGCITSFHDVATLVVRRDHAQPFANGPPSA